MSDFDRNRQFKDYKGNIITIAEMSDGSLILSADAMRRRLKICRDMMKSPIYVKDTSWESWVNRNDEILMLMKGEMRKRKLTFSKLLKDAKDPERKDDKGKTP